MASIIAAYTKTYRTIGSGGKIPWHIKEDLSRFRLITLGGIVIMGRITYESIGKPLPNRFNIVVSSMLNSNACSAPSFLTCRSVREAYKVARNLEVSGKYKGIYFCGGERIYKEAIPYCDSLYLTIIKKEYAGDRHFPPIDLTLYKRVFYEEHKEFTYITLKKAPAPLQ